MTGHEHAAAVVVEFVLDWAEMAATVAVERFAVMMVAAVVARLVAVD